MDFSRAEAEFERLKAQVKSGELTEAEFTSQLEELMIEDEQGRWWTIGPETGQWYVHDGKEWVQRKPPSPTPIASPWHSEQQVAAEPVADFLPESTVAAPLRPRVKLKLGRDWVSVLLVSGAWLVCMGVGAFLWAGGFDFLSGYRETSVFALAGGVGGLITGLVLRRTDPPTPLKQVPVVTIGWFIGGALLSLTEDSRSLLLANVMFRAAIFGLVGGLVISLALKWTHTFIQWKDVAVVTLGWVLGWVIGRLVGANMASWTLNVVYQAGSFSLPGEIPRFIDFALAGGIGGAVGSWVMFRQFRKAREGSQ
jgi:hypothetical protein